MTRQEFGERLYRFRVSKQMRQEDFAKAIGKSRASLSNIENGRQVVTLDTMNKIAQQLDMGLVNFMISPLPEAVKLRHRVQPCPKCCPPAPGGERP